MKFNVLQSNFSKTLNQVTRIVGNRTTLPVLSNVLIDVSKGKIRLSATDLEVAVTSQTAGKIEEEGKLTIPARLLSDFITNNKDELIEFKTIKDTILNLKSEHFSADINGISAEEFPTIPSLPKDMYCKLKTEDFIDAVKKVIIAPANNETRPVLAGIYFLFKGKSLILVATDSYRLAEKKIILDESLEERKFIVPARTMSEVLRLMQSNEEVGEISISSTENQISFKIGETQIVSRLIEGAFPNYKQIIPENSKTIAKLDFDEFSGAIKMSSLFAKNAANNIKIETFTDKIQVSTIALETGNSKADVAGEIEGEKVKIAFNAKYILDVLQVLSKDKLVMELNDDSSAGVIKSQKDKNYTYIVMPLKLDE